MMCGILTTLSEGHSLSFLLKTINRGKFPVESVNYLMIELHLLLFTSEYLQKSRSELENENGYEQDKYSYS